MIKAIIFIIVGFILLIKGADFLVEGSSQLAKKIRIPEIIIGLTVVSIGTSFPELFVSTTSAMNGFSDMSMGNVIGSNISNLLLILGVSAVIRPIIFQMETKWIEIPACFILTIIFSLLCNTGSGISKTEAMLLFFLFLLFIAYTIFMGLKGNDIKLSRKEKSELKKISISKNLIFVLLGIVGLKVGGDFTVDNAVYIANSFHISEHIISLTILAIGTSLPELVTSVTASMRGNSDIAIGNIIGSNIFNMLLIIGVTAFIQPIHYNVIYNIELMILLLATGLLFLFPMIPPKDEMNKFNGFVYLILYVIYMIILFYI